MDCSSADLASRDLIYNIRTRDTSIVSITLFGSILRIKEKTASLISASISCSLEAPALITAARTCNIGIGNLLQDLLLFIFTTLYPEESDICSFNPKDRNDMSEMLNHFNKNHYILNNQCKA